MVLIGKRFGRVLRQLLPPGRLFTERPGSVLERLLEGLAGEFDRVDGRGASLPSEVDPTSTTLFLREWERVLGLPDECGPAPTTSVERRSAIVGRLLSGGDLSIPTYLAIARAIGYEVTIAEGTAAPFVVGRDNCGDSLGPAAGMFAWTVTAPSGTLQLFRVGASSCGDPLATVADELLECSILRAAPAHTAVSFAYVDIGECWILIDIEGTEYRWETVGGTFQVEGPGGELFEWVTENGDLFVVGPLGQLFAVERAGNCT